MRQKWYRKSAIQAAIISGVFTIIAALITVFPLFKSKNSKNIADSHLYEIQDNTKEFADSQSNMSGKHEISDGQNLNNDEFHPLEISKIKKGSTDSSANKLIEQISQNKTNHSSTFSNMDLELLPVGVIKCLSVHSDCITKVTFSPDDRRLLSSGNMGGALLWNTQTWEIIDKMFNPKNFFSEKERQKIRIYWINCSTFSPDGRQYALSVNTEAIISEVENHNITIKRLYGGGEEKIKWIAFSSDGKLFVSANLNGIIRIWETKKWQLIREFQGNAVNNVDISANGELLLSSHRGQGVPIKGGAICLWDISKGEQIYRLNEGEVQANMVCFLPDACYAVSGEDNGIVRLWDIKKGKEIRRYAGHQNNVMSIACSPDGNRILSGDVDGIIFLWDLHTGCELERFTGHTKAVRNVTFSHDGRIAVSGGVDKNLILWKLPT